MRTLHDIKDLVAQEREFKDWQEMADQYILLKQCIHYESAVDIAMSNYALEALEDYKGNILAISIDTPAQDYAKAIVELTPQPKLI